LSNATEERPKLAANRFTAGHAGRMQIKHSEVVR
jgi:hypothetical protein